MLTFIKLDINLLSDQKIKIIRKMPGGSDIIILWIGMLSLAMKSTNIGTLEIAEGVPHDADTLSAEIDLNISTVKSGLAIFTKLKMLELLENNYLYICNFERHQSIDKIVHSREKAKERSQKYRDGKKLLLQIEEKESSRVRDANVTNDENIINKDPKDEKRHANVTNDVTPHTREEKKRKDKEENGHDFLNILAESMQKKTDDILDEPKGYHHDKK